jgi:hypothetical protein
VVFHGHIRTVQVGQDRFKWIWRRSAPRRRSGFFLGEEMRLAELIKFQEKIKGMDTDVLTHRDQAGERWEALRMKGAL